MQVDEVPYTVVLPTVYGQVLVNRYDLNQTNALVKTARGFDADEIWLMARLAAALPERSICLDIGANFGLYTLAMAKALTTGKGVVHAFEAQRMLAYMVSGSVALNSIENAYVHNLAVGEEAGEIDLPAFDYRQVSNFGSVECGPDQREFIGQPRVQSKERVKQVRIDDLGYENVGLVKLDIEGMEEAALLGAADTIETCRPVVYLEWLKSERENLALFFEHRDYDVFAAGSNFLCMPQGGGLQMQHALPKWNEA